MPFCNKCEGWYFEADREPHSCPPKWECWHEEHGEDDLRTTVYASSAVEAAEKYAAIDDGRGDYDIVNQGESGDTIVVVMRTDTQERSRLRVIGTTQPCYDAQIID